TPERKRNGTGPVGAKSAQSCWVFLQSYCLRGIDPVPARKLAADEQEIDGGGDRAARAVAGVIAKCLAKVSTLRMGTEAENGNDLRGGEARQGHGRPSGPLARF